MIPVAPWFASAVESCLSFYLGSTEQAPVQVSDDGCSLHFTSHGLSEPTLAVVAEWELSATSNRATLMDAKNQIDATFSENALQAYLQEPPALRMNQDTPKKFRIQLLDFDIVFVYSRDAPEVWLYINLFRVDWDRGVIKFVPTKKLRKTASVKPLLDSAYQKARLALKETRLDNSPSTKSIASQHEQPPRPDLHRGSSPIGESQQFLSQIPSLHGSRAKQNTANTGRPSLNGSTDLLRHLDPDPSKTSRNTQPNSLGQPSTSLDSNDANSVVNGALQHPHLNGNSNIQNSQNIDTRALQRRQSRTPDVSQPSHGSGNLASQPLEEQVQDKIQTESRKALAQQSAEPGDPGDAQTDENERLSKKRPRASTDAPSPVRQIDTEPKGSNGASPTRKRQCVEIQKEHTTNTTETEDVQEGNTPAALQETQEPTTKTDDLHQNSNPALTNPWGGLTSISDHDITIPKDQRDLFEERMCYIPPNTGEPMPQGHVPPTLLKQWNDIARRRHELAQKVHEQTPPLTTQESVLSGSEPEVDSDPGTPLSGWSGRSPHQPRRRNLLPPSSPVKQPSLSRPPTASGDRNDICVSQPAEDSSLGVANAGQDATQVEPNNAAVSNVPEASMDQDSEMATVDPQKPEALEQTAEPARLVSKSPGANISDGIQSQLAHESLGSPADKSPSRPKIPDPPAPAHEDDSDDESVMDTSVPQALGASPPPWTLDSQAGQEIPSSGHPLPGFTTSQHVQVAQTPATENTRLCRDKVQIEHSPSDSQQPSPQDKTSSQSRIFNTYPHGSHGKSDTSSSNPSLRHSGEELLQVDVIVTQTQRSSLNSSLSQSASLPSHPSQTGVVLGSSGPAHRHQDIGMSGSQAAAGPLPFAIPGGPHMSQFSQQTQDSLPLVSSLDASIMSSQISPLGHVTSKSRVQEQSPSAGRHSSARGSADPSRVPSGSPNLELVARREGFISNPDKSAEAQMVYEKFCNDYPNYPGDFTHFADICAKLQAVRNKGHLQRSFLWDDFIIMHLREYLRYIKERMSEESKMLTYEEFFSSHFSRPQHKKRSLTARGIEVSATQSASVKEAANDLPPAEPAGRSDEAMETSFTGSLVDNLSNLHAHSFGDAIRNELPENENELPDALPPMASSLASSASSSSSIMIKQEDDSFIEHSEITTSQPFYTDSDDVKPDPALLDQLLQSSARTDADADADANQPDNLLNADQDVDMAEVDHADNDADLPADNHNHNDNEDVDMPAAEDTESESESEEEQQQEEEEADYDDDDDDERHETASIELGDDDSADLTIHLSRAESRLLLSNTEAAGEADDEDEDETEEEDSEPENWFRSLRHLRSPAGPRWSDDPSTPFKVWARADQNVLVERRRRQGARILVDGDGVIRRPIYR